MSFLKRALKWSIFLGPVGYLGYNYQHLYHGSIQKDPAFHLNDLSATFQEYIRDNNLVIPYYYKAYQAKNPFNHFLEKSIIQEIKGLNEYTILLDKDYHDVITDQVEVTAEERAEFHQKAKVHCVFVANSKLQGHAGIVHGGFQATLIDNTMGIASVIAADFTPTVTAYLNMNYKKPLNTGKEYVLVIEIDKMERKKIFLKAKIVDIDNQIYTTAESLFIKTNLDGKLRVTSLLKMILKGDFPKHATNQTDSSSNPVSNNQQSSTSN